jgi:hypothetical protein
MSRRYGQHDSFILAKNSRHVYYVSYPSMCKNLHGWSISIATKPRGCVEVDNIDEESDEPPYQTDETVLPPSELEQICCLVDEMEENFQQVIDHLPEPTCEEEVVAEEQERDNENVSEHDDDVEDPEGDDGDVSDGYYIPE